jgi:hypothetical protein
MALGVYPSRRYPYSWITQRILNRAPAWAHIRKSPVSVGQRLINSIAYSIQETIQQLTKERFNLFASSADLSELDLLYSLDLPDEMEFSSEVDSSGVKTYVPPRVYATISGTEQEITQAENNDIETLAYDNIVSRIKDGETSYTYQEVIPRTLVGSLASVSPNSITVNGHLYVTLEENTTWETRSADRIYYSKIYITGTTRKGTTLTEAVPLRYNGTFKTLNEWQEVDSLLVSYVDSDAYITLETFPWARDGILDTQNILAPAEGGERPLYIDISTRSWGSTLVGKGFTVSDFDIVRAGIEEKETFHEIELLDETGNNVQLTSFVLKPNSRFMYAVDDDNFYVYDTSLEYPDTRDMLGESPETKIDLWSDRWIYTRGTTATIRTRNNAILDPPSRIRWTLLNPNGNEYYISESGTLLPTTSDAWIENVRWGDGIFEEAQVPVTFISNGIYIVTLEAQYWNDDFSVSATYNTKYLFFVPSISPEIQLSLPSSLSQPDEIGIDSDLRVWLKKYGAVHLLEVFHDYFLVDYQNKRIWCKEQYPSIRVTV